MGLFGFMDVTKEGPGVSKNGPRKRGFVVFFEIYKRKFWSLLSAGLLWLVVSLPLVTRGWADAGLTFITRNYTREKHAFIKGDFFDTIKRNRKQALVCGIINLLVTGIIFFNLGFFLISLYPVQFYQLMGVMDEAVLKELKPWDMGVMGTISLGCTLTAYLLFTWMKYYIPFLVVTFKLRTKQVYKNAFLFAIAGLKRNLLISVVLILVYGLMFGAFLLMPTAMTLVVLLLLGLLLVPAFRSFLIQYNIFPEIKRLMIDPYYAANPNADKQARLDLNLEVEETAPATPEEAAQAEANAPVFSDEALIPEPTNIPKQYNEREMRRFNSRVQQHNDDDDTI